MHGKAPLLTMVKGSNWQVSDIGDLKGDHVWEHGDRWRCVARQSTDGNGKAIDAHERWVDTWMKMPNGKWQCIATAGAPAKM